MPQPITVWLDAEMPTDPAWEDAYRRFETKQEEISKFVRRLQCLGAAHWSRESKIVEIFCGRGNGLHALSTLGFDHLEGVDLSQSLLALYEGEAALFAGDCRALAFEDASRDVVIVNGGLHHLPDLPQDLDRVLCEVSRCLHPGGLFCCVEPWLTPFLSFVHASLGIPGLRRVWPKLDAFGVMFDLEGAIYKRWLAHPEMILNLLTSYFKPRIALVRWGKLVFCGVK